MSYPSDESLTVLEAKVNRAFETGDSGELTILGYGEISIVLACKDGGDDFACKRLPPFSTADQLAAYRAVFDQYLDKLSALGVDVLESSVKAVPLPDGGWTAYCVQPMLPAASLLPNILHEKSAEEASELVEDVFGAIRAAIVEGVGIDGQSSNWAVHHGRLRYLDVTTPFLRSSAGEELLDYQLFIASLPWLLRGVVRRFLLKAILDKYYQRRGAILDFLANLAKEQLHDRIPRFLEIANTSLDEKIDHKEVQKYYRVDARMWAFLQTIRRLDRFWQRRVRRRVYPFLLPPKIVRNV